MTNGKKATNGSPAEKSDSAGTTSLFSNKAASSAIFNMPMSSSPPTKPTFGISGSQSSTLFGGTTNTTSGQSLFTASKADSTGESPFKIKSTSTDTGSTDTAKASMFGASTDSTPFKIKPMTNTPKIESNFGIQQTTPNKDISEAKGDEKKDDKKLKYYAKLKGLNESVSDWIKKHVEETPLCILSPIFKDYEKYLKEIQAEYEGDKETSNSSNKMSDVKQNVTKSTSEPAKNPASSLFSSTPSQVSKTSIFPAQNNTGTPAEKSAGFSFGINSSANNASTTTASAGFSFGINSPPKTTTTNVSPFSLASTTNTTSSNGTAPFSFGIGKPFSFSSNVQSNNTEEKKETNEEDDEPPKVEFTPVVEENSVFEKKCKIFIKKDGNFVDKGVGTLYIKKVEDTGKFQLLARANTNLGNVLLNLILSSSIPTQRLGKNNVMMVCIPTPDAKPPPTPILIRVKTSEEADDLLETLNKYKV